MENPNFEKHILDMELPILFLEGGVNARANPQARRLWELPEDAFPLSELLPPDVVSLFHKRGFPKKNDFLKNVFVRDKPYNVLVLISQGRPVLLFHAADPGIRESAALMSALGGEIRRPLTLIMSSMNYLAGRLESSPKISHYIETVFQGCFQLLRLSNNMMTLPRYERGEMELFLCERNLVSFSREVLRSVEPFAALSDISLMFESSSDRIPVAFDEQKMERVLLNLLSNAVKAVEKGGEVTMTVTEEEDRVLVRVADNGCGIEPERLKGLFVQTGASAAGEAWTAMGLALVRAIVDLHGGKLSAESQVGAGTVVTVSLPKSPIAPTFLRGQPISYDYSGEFPHALVEFSDTVPGARSLYKPCLPTGRTNRK